MPAGAQDQLAANLAVLRDLENLAVIAAASGDGEGAVRLVQAAADWAWHAHTGTFVSLPLEALVLDVARRELHAGAPSHRRRRSGPRRVLHVLTQGYDTGGHTRLAWRWILQDRSSTHDVVLTSQPQPPQALRAATVQQGGRVHALTQPDLLDRARALRELAADADVAVLHVHPYDVVAAVAFAGRTAETPGATTLLLNHADHVFWLGAGSADLVVNARDIGDDIAVQRRGIDASRLVRLPLPLELALPGPTRAAARAQLGLPQDAVVLLTSAAAYKYDGDGTELTFLDLTLPVLEDRDDVHLLAVGPSDATPSWAGASRRTDGRLRALGYRSDLDLLRRAADVYLDSYPCGSPTALLEAGLQGLPALSFLPEGRTAVALTAASPGLQAGWLTATTPADYAQRLLRLIGEPAHRQQSGRTLAASVAAAHCGDAWTRQLKSVYDAAEHAGPAVLPAELDAGPDLLDARLLQLHGHGEMSLSVEEVLARHRAVVPVTPDGPKLSVVLAVTGSAASTVGALETVLDHCSAVGRLEAIVVDNASTDETAELLHALAGDLLSTRFTEPVAAGTAWRRGLSMATGELVLVLSNDVRLTTDFLAPLVRQLGAAPHRTAAAPVLAAPGVRRATSGLETMSGVCILAQRVPLAGGASLSVVTVQDSVVDLLPLQGTDPLSG